MAAFVPLLGHGSAETSVRIRPQRGSQRPATAANLVASAAGWAAAPSSCSMPAPRLVPFRAAGPVRRPAAPSAWGPQQAGPRPLRDYPGPAVISGCGERSRGALASIPLPLGGFFFILGPLGPKKMGPPPNLSPWAAQRRSGDGHQWLPRPALPTTPAPGLLGRLWQFPAPAAGGAQFPPQGKRGRGRDGGRMRLDHNPHKTPRASSGRSSLGPLLEAFCPGDSSMSLSCRWCPAARPIHYPVLADHANLIRDSAA